MKALSIQQPWPYAILYLQKDVENRDWPTKFTGRIKIHAGKKYDQKGHDWLVKQGFTIPANLPMGGFVGEVDITGCHQLGAVNCDPNVAASKWAFGDYCFSLANPVPHDLIPARGMLNFFEVPA